MSSTGIAPKDRLTALGDLSGRVAIVTGAVGLIGREHSDALAEAGAHLALVDLNQEPVERLARELSERHGVEALGIAASITDREALSAIRDRLLRRFDRIDVLVNNAAVDDKVTAGHAGYRFEDYPLGEWQRLLDVNLTGTYLCCQVFGGKMAERRSGSIINVASTYGLVAPQQSLYTEDDGRQAFIKSAAYPVTKAGVIQLTRYLAAYWGPVGVRVNALCPGGVEAGQPQAFQRRYAERTPLGRMAKSSEYRGAVVFLASEASSYMTGANLVVDGGWTAW